MTPDQHTNLETFLNVGDGHELYIQDWGNPKGAIPIIFLHGGPGTGCNDRHRASFDPHKNRVIFFDQRGSGRSLPYGSLEHNTTPDLVNDISKIADHFGLKTFVLWGGSWGATLALAYGVAHPTRAHALVLNGVLTGSQSEIDWVDKGGFRPFCPEAWERYLQATPKAHHADPTAYHYSRILGDDPEAARQSAYAYETLEGSAMSMDDRYTPQDPAEFDPVNARLEALYLKNRCFMPDRHIFDNAHRLTMPVWLVQGRYDLVCPPAAAYELHQKLPNSHFIPVIGNHRAEREAHSVLRTLAMQFEDMLT